MLLMQSRNSELLRADKCFTDRFVLADWILRQPHHHVALHRPRSRLPGLREEKLGFDTGYLPHQSYRPRGLIVGSAPMACLAVPVTSDHPQLHQGFVIRSSDTRSFAYRNGAESSVA